MGAAPKDASEVSTCRAGGEHSDCRRHPARGALSRGDDELRSCPAALPIRRYRHGALPWNAVSFESSIDNTKMLGNPHAASEDGEEALTYRMANSQIGLYVENAIGTTSWIDVSTLVDTPTPASDPVPSLIPRATWTSCTSSTEQHLIMIILDPRRRPARRPRGGRDARAGCTSGPAATPFSKRAEAGSPAFSCSAPRSSAACRPKPATRPARDVGRQFDPVSAQ